MRRFARLGSSFASALTAVCLTVGVVNLASQASAQPAQAVVICPKPCNQGRCADCTDPGHACGGGSFATCSCDGPIGDQTCGGD